MRKFPIILAGFLFGTTLALAAEQQGPMRGPTLNIERSTIGERDALPRHERRFHRGYRGGMIGGQFGGPYFGNACWNWLQPNGWVYVCE
jgi:hypothetical protein